MLPGLAQQINYSVIIQEHFKMGIEKESVRLSKNPLGIIALFILLIYSFATLLFGLSGENFSEAQKWFFVIFLVAFPVIVLFLFTYLVVNHNQKLYAPEDFKNEENFWRPSSSSDNQEKYDNEAREVQKEHEKSNTSNNKVVQLDAEQRRKRFEEQREKIQKMENLVFDYYEKKFDYSISKNVYFKINDRRVNFDGISIKDNTLNFFEIKFSSPRLINEPLLSKMILDTVKVRDSLIKNNSYPGYQYRLKLNFVIETDDVNEIYDFKKRIDSLIKTDVIDIDLKVFTVNELESMLF